MKKKQRIAIRAILITFISLSVLIVAALFIKNSDNTSIGKEEGSNSNDEKQAEEPMVISIGIWGIQDYFVGDEVMETIEKKFNISLEPVSINYMNWTQEFQKMAASNTLPDVFATDIVASSTYATWVEQSKIRALPTDLSDYPNLKEYMNLEYNQIFKENDGQFYMIPRLTYPEEDFWALDRCIVLQKKWMEQLGLSIPQNYEEFKKLLIAFQESDLDENGLMDTIGLATENLNTLEAIYLSIFPELSNVERGWMEEEGRWIPVYASQKTGKALAYTKELYDLGLLDQNFPYRTINQAFALFTNKQCGALSCQYFSLLKYWNSIEGNKDHTDDIVIMTPWKAEDGNTYRFTSSLHWSETYFKSSVSDEKMAKILQLYDYLLSDEAQELLSHKGDKEWVDKNPSISIFSTLVSWDQEKIYEKLPYSVGIYGEENIDYASEMLDWYRQNTVKVDYDYNIVFSSTPSKLLLPIYAQIQEDMVQTIVGNNNAVTAWDEVLDKYRNESSLVEAINEVTKRQRE